MKTMLKIVVIGVLLIFSLLLGLWIGQRSHAVGRQKVAIDSSTFSISGPNVPRLHVDSVVEHGHIIEIRGSAEPGASVMINGEPAPVMFEGSTFRHFVGPLPAGVTVFTISAQTEDGGVNTQRAAVEVR